MLLLYFHRAIIFTVKKFIRIFLQQVVPMSANIGTGELIVILIVALLIIGPDKLPKVARAVGKAVAGFKSYMNDVTEDLKDVSTEFKDVSDSLTVMQKDMQQTIKSAFEDVDGTVKSVDTDLKNVGADVGKSVNKAIKEPVKSLGKSSENESAAPRDEDSARKSPDEQDGEAESAGVSEETTVQAQ